MESLRYWLYGALGLGGIITIWKEHGSDAGLVILFVWMSAFVLGAKYQRSHPDQ